MLYRRSEKSLGSVFRIREAVRDILPHWLLESFFYNKLVQKVASICFPSNSFKFFIRKFSFELVPSKKIFFKIDFPPKILTGHVIRHVMSAVCGFHVSYFRFWKIESYRIVSKNLDAIIRSQRIWGQIIWSPDSEQSPNQHTQSPR